MLGVIRIKWQRDIYGEASVWNRRAIVLSFIKNKVVLSYPEIWMILVF